MEKTLYRIILIVLAIWFFIPSAYAYDFCVDGICYNILSKEELTCEVTSNPDVYKGHIDIPGYVDYGLKTYKVVAIGIRAFDEEFYDQPFLTSLTIPTTVERIGFGAFSLCSGLTSIEIPNSVKYIDDYAFYYCRNLLAIDIPDSVIKIGAEAFSYCNLKHIVILDGENPIEIESTALGGADELNVYIGRSIINEDNGELWICPVRIDLADGIDIGNLFELTKFGDCLRILNFGKNIKGLPQDLTKFEDLVNLTVHHELPYECPQFSDAQFGSIKLIVPDGSKQYYMQADGWCNFNDIEEASDFEELEIFIRGSMCNWEACNEWKFTPYDKDATIYKFAAAGPQKILRSDEFKFCTVDWSQINFGMENMGSTISFDQMTKLDTSGNGWTCKLESDWNGICWLDVSSGNVIFTDDPWYIPDFSVNKLHEIEGDNEPCEKKIFNLQGIRLNAGATSPGLYIIKDNNEVKKLYIK